MSHRSSNVVLPGTRLLRREFLKWSTAASVTCAVSGWFKAFAEQAGTQTTRRRSCILLWMPGGPSQTDTFDPKPGHANGGPFQAIETSVPGIRISEHLPKLARHMHHLVPIRSMQSREGDHGRGTYFVKTGYAPQGPVAYPTFGSLVSHERQASDRNLPGFVSIAPLRLFSPGAFSAGFLGPQYAPLVVGEASFGRRAADPDEALRVENLERDRAVTSAQAAARLEMLERMEHAFVAEHPDAPARAHRDAYQQATRMMQPESAATFDLTQEDDALRDAYGRNSFGQACLLARRLVERGVPFVEISLSQANGVARLGWDTHSDNFETVQALSGVLDAGWATLIGDLQSRGLLENTVMAWMGEFGRTPQINGRNGRDHFPQAWTTVLGGGGIRGGQVVGRTSDSGLSIEDRPVTVPDLLSTLCSALGIDHLKQNMSNVGRPIRIAAYDARPISEILL